MKPTSKTTPPAKSTAPAKRGSTSRKTSTTSERTNRSGTSNTGGEEAAANERTYWESIRNSTDPEDFRLYLRKYPNGQFADLATKRISDLEAGKSQPATGNTGGQDIVGGASGATRKDLSGGAGAATPRAGAVVRNQMGIELVFVPAGSFMMGAENRVETEKPVHQVVIRDGFYMGRYEVTQKEWQAVMGSNPSSFKGENLPVENVSWNDAQEFIQKLNARGDGFTYRLPTESEWEYACRAGTTGDYAGNLGDMGWYYENSGDSHVSDASWSADNAKKNNNRTHPVGSKQPNAWGFYDMHGNVFEWCEDFWHDNYIGAPADGSAWLSGGNPASRMLRGGSWGLFAYGLRSAIRGTGPSSVRDSSFGFRLVAVARQ